MTRGQRAVNSVYAQLHILLLLLKRKQNMQVNETYAGPAPSLPK